MAKSKITFPEFLEISKKLEIQVGKVTKVERVPKSNKLLHLTVDFSENGTPEKLKNCVTNLGERFKPEQFIDKVFPFVTNLEPSKMMGVESEVMIIVGQFANEDVWVGDLECGTFLM
jgi:methionyl-tRNA synthetase